MISSFMMVNFLGYVFSGVEVFVGSLGYVESSKTEVLVQDDRLYVPQPFLYKNRHKDMNCDRGQRNRSAVKRQIKSEFLSRQKEIEK